MLMTTQRTAQTHPHGCADANSNRNLTTACQNETLWLILVTTCTLSQRNANLRKQLHNRRTPSVRRGGRMKDGPDHPRGGERNESERHRYTSYTTQNRFSPSKTHTIFGAATWSARHLRKLVNFNTTTTCYYSTAYSPRGGHLSKHL